MKKQRYSSGDAVDVALYNDHLIIKGGLNKQEITLKKKQVYTLLLVIRVVMGKMLF